MLPKSEIENFHLTEQIRGQLRTLGAIETYAVTESISNPKVTFTEPLIIVPGKEDLVVISQHRKFSVKSISTGRNMPQEMFRDGKIASEYWSQVFQQEPVVLDTNPSNWNANLIINDRFCSLSISRDEYQGNDYMAELSADLTKRIDNRKAKELSPVPRNPFNRIKN